ncbi:MAG: hypothetical protein K0M49_19475 [Arenimonas sp.]|nr:hypothetical protein [Arenimonas sp.]
MPIGSSTKSPTPHSRRVSLTSGIGSPTATKNVIPAAIALFMRGRHFDIASYEYVGIRIDRDGLHRSLDAEFKEGTPNGCNATA